MDGYEVIFVMGWDVGEDGLDGKENWDAACLLNGGNSSEYSQLG